MPSAQWANSMGLRPGLTTKKHSYNRLVPCKAIMSQAKKTRRSSMDDADGPDRTCACASEPMMAPRRTYCHAQKALHAMETR